MASPEFPQPEQPGQPEQIPSKSKLKDLTPAEWMEQMNKISADLKGDADERVRKVRERIKEEVMKEKIAAYRDKFGQDSADLTDEDIRKIIIESEGHSPDSQAN